MSTDTKRRAARIIQRSVALSPQYDRAIREEDLAGLLLVRHEMAAAVRQADRLLADAIADNIERRLDDG